jgi:hypothetical protein
VPFESVNVAAEPTGMAELQALGARSVPVVARGGRYVYAQSLADVAAFLAMDVRVEARLAPEVLVERVNIVVAAAMRYVRQMSDAELDGPFRNSWAPPRGLAHHVVRIVEAFLDAVEKPEELSYESTMRGTHEVLPGQDIATYADAVLVRFNAWWARLRRSLGAGAHGHLLGRAVDARGARAHHLALGPAHPPAHRRPRQPGARGRRATRRGPSAGPAAAREGLGRRTPEIRVPDHITVGVC